VASRESPPNGEESRFFGLALPTDSYIGFFWITSQAWSTMRQPLRLHHSEAPRTIPRLRRHPLSDASVALAETYGVASAITVPRVGGRSSRKSVSVRDDLRGPIVNGVSCSAKTTCKAVGYSPPTARLYASFPSQSARVPA
jgi:hypothetical protein